MSKKTSLVLIALLLIVCVVLCALRASKGPALLPVSELPAREEAAPEATPHRHLFDPETGLCTLCGFVCDHSLGFDGEHRCLVCGWRCRNQSHDPETALCPICGEAFCHHFGMDGVCDVCGAEAPLYFAELPERYFQPSEHEGRCFRETLSDGEEAELEIAVWLPWDYSEETRYNVVVLMHGDGGQAADWTDEPEPTRLGEIEFRRVFDRMVEERLCEPFLIVGISNRAFAQPEKGEKVLRELLLPYVAQHFSTYLGGGSPEELRAGRAHLAVGGLSRGALSRRRREFLLLLQRRQQPRLRAARVGGKPRVRDLQLYRQLRHVGRSGDRFDPPEHLPQHLQPGRARDRRAERPDARRRRGA